MSNPFTVLSALILTIGILGFGWFMGDGLRHIRPAERAVTVRGLAEKEVAADTVRLVVSFSHAGDATAEILPRMQETQKKIAAFLESNGIKKEELEYAP